MVAEPMNWLTDLLSSKIVEGRVQGFFKEVALLEQPYAKDDSQSVQKFIGGASIVKYAQVEIG